MIRISIVVLMIIIISGLVVRQMGTVHSLSEGIVYYLSGAGKILKKAGKFLYEIFYAEVMGQEVPEKAINQALILSNQECLELISKFDKHPYETPTCEKFFIQNGIMFIALSAVGLVPSYETCSQKEIIHLCCNIVQNYFLQTRETKVSVYIKSIGGKQFSFAIPLSKEGQELLEKQEEERKKALLAKKQKEALTEKVEEEQSEEDDENRI